MIRWLVCSFLVLSLVSREPAMASDPPLPGFLGFAYTLQTSAGNPPRPWMHVRAVQEGGPASLAGLRPNDIIVAIDGKPVRFANNTAMVLFFAKLKPADKIRFTVVRGEHQHVVTVSAVEMPPELAARWRENFALAMQKDATKP